MAKSLKYGNLYDKDGNLLRKCNDRGELPDYTIEELEQLIDKLAEDKDENGRIKDPKALNNCNMILMQMYQKYGNPHEAELIQKLKEAQSNKTTEQQVNEKIQEVVDQLGKSIAEDTTEDDKYDEFEQIDDLGVKQWYENGAKTTEERPIIEDCVPLEETLNKAA